MSHNVTFEDLFINILRDYYDTFGGDPLNVDYKITDNIVDEYAKLRPYHVAKEPEKIQTLSAYNGMTVCPTSVGGTFTILINKAFVMQYIGQNNMTWVGTIIHETTHVRDYIDYAHLISATDYEDILNINKNLPFQLWTEFNARARGYYFVRKYTFENMFDKTQINDIVQIELPGQEELLYKNYHQTQDGVQQAYYVSHFLGRLYTLQEIFPDYFTDEWIEAYPLFENNEWMYKWYLFLKKNADLKSAFENFDEMKRASNVTRPSSEEYPFVGKMYCSVCGQYFGQYTTATLNRERYSIYRCSSRKNHSWQIVPGMVYVRPHTVRYTKDPSPELVKYRERYCPESKPREYRCSDTRVALDRPRKAFVQAWNVILRKKQRYLSTLQAEQASDDIFTRYHASVLAGLLQVNEKLTEFDTRLFRKTVERIDVQPSGKMTFTFKAGIKITV